MMFLIHCNSDSNKGKWKVAIKKVRNRVQYDNTVCEVPGLHALTWLEFPAVHMIPNVLPGVIPDHRYESELSTSRCSPKVK